MHESMFWTNWSGFLVAALLCLLTGQATEGTAFCTRHPEVLNAILIYSVASAVGQTFIYYTITQFNPLVLTTVTTTRKIFTTVYSVFRNPANRLALGQWAGCSLVFVGILMDIAVEARGLPLMRSRPCMHRSAAACNTLVHTACCSVVHRRSALPRSTRPRSRPPRRPRSKRSPKSRMRRS